MILQGRAREKSGACALEVERDEGKGEGNSTKLKWVMRVGYDNGCAEF